MAQTAAKKRVVSGIRPTGKLHIGHYFGAVRNWIELSKVSECFFFSADWHALTTDFKDTSGLRTAEREMFFDFAAAGLDLDRCIVFVQSAVLQHAELALLLGMITPLGWLERVPTYKEQQRQLADRDLGNFGFLGYPVLQAADIAAYRADGVPVGEDQVAHLELTREIIRRFNHLYGPVLVEPQPILTPTPRVLGLDGRKMSKSYGNAVLMGEDPAEARRKIKLAVTDPARVHRQDPGNPEICPIYHLHRCYSGEERIRTVNVECRRAGIGCVECKNWLLEGLLPELEKHRTARATLDAHPERVESAVERGNQRAREVAESTLAQVRGAMRLA